MSEFDTYDTIVDIMPPPADILFKATKAALLFMGYFTDADPLAFAVAEIQREIQGILQTLGFVNERLNDLTRALAKVDNRGRVDKLNDCARSVNDLAFALSQKPADINARAQLAHNLGSQVDRFLDDPDLWLWTDLNIHVDRDAYGNPLPPVVTLMPADFKSHLALPVYSQTLMTWLTAIDFHARDNYALVQSTYGDQLRRHIYKVSSRPDWNEGAQPPDTFPENIRSRITCRVYAQNKYADVHGQCTFEIECENVMDRNEAAVGETVLDMNIPAGANAVFCTAPPNLGQNNENQIEDQYGVQALGALEAALRRLESTGSLREPAIPSFDTTPFYNVAFLYGVNAAGDLLWFKQLPSSGPNAPAGWAGPVKVGNGWGDFRAILPAGGNRFYAVAQDGSLLWYEHHGFNDGTFDWKGPVKVGSGWAGFSSIVAGSDGVLYAVQPDGSLLWYRNDGYTSGTPSWRGPINVGSGWNTFTAIFSAGNGILYAVSTDGTLWWYSHQGFRDGINSWAFPKKVGSGWQNFAHIFSAGAGIIYGLQPDGTLLWYKHDQWDTGPVMTPGPSRIGTHVVNNWEGPIVAAKGWTGYRFILAILPTTAAGPA